MPREAERTRLFLIRKTLHRLAARLLCALFFVLTAPAWAILPATPESPAATPAAQTGQQIEDTQDAGADARIARRIRSIFDELPALSEVQVEVSQGVVSLSGAVPSDEDIGRAEAIASRVAGVVTVDNALERDVSIGEDLGGLSTLSDRIADFSGMLPLIGLAFAVAIGIVLIGYLIAGLGSLWHRLAPNSFLAELIASAIRFVFIVGGIVVALEMIGAGALLGAVLGGAGLLGVALGFAMRDTIENYVASLMLSVRQPFRANDHVLIEEHEGRVIRLTSRATILMTLDGNHLRIPNSTVFKAVILNYTRNPQRRFEFDLGIDADDNPAAARKLGRETLAGFDFVLNDPPPEARVVEVGDSNIVLKFLGWIDQRETDWFKARSRAIAEVKAALEEAGFALPEPIYRLRFDPRTKPLPLANVPEDTSRREDAETPQREAVVPPGHDHDVTPDNEVARMVNAERFFQSPERDLLDPERPVE